jgi:apolipoprotein N-acyltransferase
MTGGTMPGPDRIRRALAAVAAGALIALSVPPFGWWVLAPVGTAIFATLLWDRPWRSRAAIGFGVGLGQFGIGIFFITEFHAVGFIALLLLGAGYQLLAGALTPPNRMRLLGLPAALVLVSRGREVFPFGGFPLGDASLGQAASPLAPVARLGGTILVVAAIGLLGTSLALTASRLAHRDRRAPVAALVGLAVVVALVVVGRVGPGGTTRGADSAFRIAAVQGGGVRGLRAIHSDAELVFQRHLTAARSLVQPPVDVVLWPEDVLDVPGPVAGTPEAADVAGLARSLPATVIVGVVEDTDPDHFRNAALVWGPDGQVIARFDKVHRVPFGEYIPGRFLIRHLADLSVIPRDAIAGHGPGLLRTPVGPLGVMISYEVFFPARARAAVRAGAQLLLVPTNASSYRTGQVPAQEIAAARLRAWETGRQVVQSAPTGYTAIIDARGHVLARSRLGPAQVLQAVVHPRVGQTVFVRWGDRWLIAAAAVVLLAAWRPRLMALIKGLLNPPQARAGVTPLDQPVNGRPA